MSVAQDNAVILIIDSDPLLLTGMAAVLHMQGYECHCAQAGEAAVKAARTLELDLIICDVKLKRESGLELCERLGEYAPGVPVLYVSANQQPDIIRRAHETGGAYYLRKPFDPEVLIELVEKALWMPHLVQSHLDAAEAAHGDVIEQVAAARVAAESAPATTAPQGEPRELEPAHKHDSAPAPNIGRATRRRRVGK